MLYLITETDDYGRPQINILLVEAQSPDEARERASEALNNPEIVTTSWYRADPITEQEIEKQKYSLRSQLEFFERRI